jgi:hypothetical protein
MEIYPDGSANQDKVAAAAVTNIKKNICTLSQ